MVGQDNASNRGPGDHELRVSLSEIMHTRILQVPKVPARVRQWLILHGDEDIAGRDDWLHHVTQGRAAQGAGRFTVDEDDVHCVWEAHTEFSTITLITTDASSCAPLDDCSWLRGMPGEIFRSVEILIGSRTDFDWEAEACFDPTRIVSSLAFGGVARPR